MRCKRMIKKSRLALFLAVGILLVLGAFSTMTIQADSGEPIIIKHGSKSAAGSMEVKGTNTYGYGEWKVSNHEKAKGYDGKTATLYSDTAGAYYKWFTTLPAGTYEVFIYNIKVGPNDNNAIIEIGEGTKVLGTAKNNYDKPAESGWVNLGTYKFEGTAEAYVKNTKSAAAPMARADAVKFEIVGNDSPTAATPQTTPTIAPTAKPIETPKPTPKPTATPKPEGISVKINGTLQNYDQQPMIINDRTMVPLRGIFEALGAAVSWDENTETVTANKGDITITLKIGDSKAFVKGSEKILDQPAQVVNGRTLVPVRFIGEALGAKVDWDESNQIVNITIAADDN